MAVLNLLGSTLPAMAVTAALMPFAGRLGA